MIDRYRELCFNISFCFQIYVHAFTYDFIKILIELAISLTLVYQFYLFVCYVKNLFKE